MRKSVKLAAASSLAAVAMIGASATAASAHSATGNDPLNICGNSADGPAAVATDHGTSSIGPVTKTGESHQVICQNGKENYAFNYYYGDVSGGALNKIVDIVKNITVTVS